jgi:hypothetical protein
MVDQQSHSNNAPEHRLPTDESDDHKRHRAYQLVVPYYSCSNSMVQNNIVRLVWFGLDFGKSSYIRIERLKSK